MAVILLLLLVGSLVMGALTKQRNWLIPIGVFAVMYASKLADAPWWLYGVIIGVGLLAYAAAARRYNHRSARTPVIGAVVLSILAFVGLIVSAILATPSQAAATSTPDQATINALTVTTVPKEAQCATDGNGLVAWDIGSLKSGRKWPDALEPPFTTSTSETRRAEVYTTDCTDPNYLVTNANFFANMTLGNVKVVDLNPWLKPFVGKSDTLINTKAASYVPLLNVKNPSDAQVADAVTKNKEAQELAAKVNTLYSKFHPIGVHSEKSILNYHLLIGGLVADTLPAIGLNEHQESLPAEQYALTDKGQSTCFAKIGFNVGDRRPEMFSCATYVPPPGSTPKPGTTTHPGTPGTPTTAPPGGCKTGCSPTPPTTAPPTTTPPSHKCVPPKPYGTWPNCYGSKSPAPQPSGVEKPTNNPVGPVQNTPPPPKSTPLQPGGGGSTQTTAPANNNPGNPVTGAPTGEGPTSCVPPPGKTSC